MSDDLRCIYDSWNKSEAHSNEWWDKTKDFIECAFSLSSVGNKIRCPCIKCHNTKSFDKIAMTKHICQNGFAPDYEIWVFQDEKYNAVAAEEEVNEREGTDMMDEMLEAIQTKFTLDTDDLPMLEVEEFFRLQKSHYMNTRK
jgi:hypothetical protein